MRNLKRKDLVNLINPNDWVSKFENELDNDFSGWVILWNDKIVKPKGGNSYYFASEKAAKQSLERNITFLTDARNHICEKLNGFIYYCPMTETLQGQYNKEWERYYMQNEYSAHWKLPYREREKIEAENSAEFQLMKSRRDEWDMIHKFAGGFLTTVLIPTWIKEGKLEIKQV